MPIEIEGENSEGRRRIDIQEWRVERAAERMRALAPMSVDNLTTDLLVRLGKIHRKQSRGLFATEGARGGEAWAKLDPEYAAKKRQAVPGKKILVWDGTLRDAVTKEDDPRYIQRLEIGREIAFEFGVDSFLGRIHTEEGIRRRTDKPPRKRQRAKRGAVKRARGSFGGSRKPPTFSGQYEIIKRSVVQKSPEQVSAFVEESRQYFLDRGLAGVREALGLPTSPGTSAFGGAS